MKSHLTKQWRVQWRENKKAAWVNAGLFETRVAAYLNTASIERG